MPYRAIRAAVFVGWCEVNVGSWRGRGLNRGFESGESRFEDAGDGKEAEQGGFGDVAAAFGVIEQGCAQE